MYAGYHKVTCVWTEKCRAINERKYETDLGNLFAKLDSTPVVVPTQNTYLSVVFFYEFI